VSNEIAPRPFRVSSRIRAFSLVMIAALALPSSGCRPARVALSHWTPTLIVVDGQAADWENLPVTFYEEQQVSLGLANDSSRLYILMRFRDPKWPRTIRMTGLDLCFDRNGGTDRKFVLRYRGGPEGMPMPGGDSLPFPMPDLLAERDQFSDDSSAAFTCFIDGRIYEKPIPTDGAEGPAAAAGIERGSFTYEFAVPLPEGAVRHYGINAQPGQVIGLGASWGDMSELSERMREDAPPEMDMRPPDDGMFPPAGGMGPGGPPDGMGGRSGKWPEMPEKQEVWLKVTLATPLSPSN